jgi:HlyD family secretion protein
MQGGSFQGLDCGPKVPGYQEGSMTSRLIAVLSAASLAAGVYSATSSSTGNPPPARTGDELRGRIVTAPGAVEPVSEEIDVGAELPGKLERVLIDEGTRVRAGQAIAVIANPDYRAQVASAQATLGEREAALRRVTNGARTQERREALAAVEEADVVLANAVTERDRRRELLEQGAISREEADRAEQAWLVARARKEAAAERHALVDDEAREEDRSQAAAAVDNARAAVALAEAMLAKTYVRSPIDGVVLRKHHHAGETVLNSPADPIATIGDTSRLRVRAEVDELDIAHIRPGQRAYVRADAFGDRKFFGVIAEVGQALGKKIVRTERPAERVDTKVLEVLVDLERPDGLRPRLRVDVFVDIGGESRGEE